MNLTKEEFRHICLMHGILSPDSVLDGLYSDLKKRDAAGKQPGVQEFLAVYCDAYRARYKTLRGPDITGKDAGIAKRIVKDLGSSRAIALVETYLRMGEFHGRHDLAVFEARLKSVGIAHDTGKAVTRSDVRQVEKKESNPFAKMLTDRSNGHGSE